MGTRKQPIPVALAAVALACVLVWHFMDQRTQDRKIQALERTVETLQASLRQKEDELTQTPLHVRDGNDAQSPAGGRGAAKSSVPAAPGTLGSSPGSSGSAIGSNVGAGASASPVGGDSTGAPDIAQAPPTRPLIGLSRDLPPPPATTPPPKKIR